MGGGRKTAPAHQPGGFPRMCNFCGSGTSLRGTRARRTHRIHTSEGTHDNPSLRASAPQSAVATLGEPSRAQRRTAGGGTMVEGLKSLKVQEGLGNPTLDRTRRFMSLVYKHSQRYGLIPRTQESHPMRFVRCKTTSEYEAMILTPEQAYAVLHNLGELERTLTLLAAGTGLRISECLGLQWQDVSFTEAVIQVRRTWTCGQVGWPKSKASKGPVPLHPLLAEFMFRWKQKTPYFQSG